MKKKINSKKLVKRNNLEPTINYGIDNKKGLYEVPFLIHPQINPVLILK